MAGVSEKMVSVATSSDCLKFGFEMFPYGVSRGSNSPLSVSAEGFLNGVSIDPAKIRPELLKVNGLRGDSMFVLSKAGDEGMLNSSL